MSSRFENVAACYQTMTADLRQIVESVLLVFAALFPIVNPLGGAPIFLAMTSDYAQEERAALAWRVTVNALRAVANTAGVGKSRHACKSSHTPPSKQAVSTLRRGHVATGTGATIRGSRIGRFTTAAAAASAMSAYHIH